MVRIYVLSIDYRTTCVTRFTLDQLFPIGSLSKRIIVSSSRFPYICTFTLKKYFVQTEHNMHKSRGDIISKKKKKLTNSIKYLLRRKLYLLHCVKIVRIWSCSGPYFPAFGLNTKIYSLSLRFQSKCGKIRTRITPNKDTLHALLSFY